MDAWISSTRETLSPGARPQRPERGHCSVQGSLPSECCQEDHPRRHLAIYCWCWHLWSALDLVVGGLFSQKSYLHVQNCQASSQFLLDQEFLGGNSRPSGQRLSQCAPCSLIHQQLSTLRGHSREAEENLRHPQGSWPLQIGHLLQEVVQGQALQCKCDFCEGGRVDFRRDLWDYYEAIIIECEHYSQRQPRFFHEDLHQSAPTQERQEKSSEGGESIKCSWKSGCFSRDEDGSWCQTVHLLRWKGPISDNSAGLSLVVINWKTIQKTWGINLLCWKQSWLDVQIGSSWKKFIWLFVLKDIARYLEPTWKRVWKNSWEKTVQNLKKNCWHWADKNSSKRFTFQ